MFNQNIQRIGFACKIQESLGVPDPKLNIKSTTITWLNNATKIAAVDKLWALTQHNVTTLAAQVAWVAQQKPELRMFRISSDVLPAYTHDNWMWFYFQIDVQNYLERELLKIGDFARQHDVRLSFHPGQFCVLASDNPCVVENSLVEFEYHCDLIRYMGYGKQYQDFKCNVHVGGKNGPAGIRAALQRLSPEAHNCLTIENAEYSWGLDASLELVNDCALVLDIHHHWIACGEYLQPTDKRVRLLWESWRGVRPTTHYSVTRELVLPDHSLTDKPDLELLKTMGHKSTALRAHSELYWNKAVNQWAIQFLEFSDIMCEAKEKNIASFKFNKYRLELYNKV